MAIGRPALNQLLKRTIPDDYYAPSTLHVRLLELPWSDVFTTNYDTLLERASHEVTRQQYNLVVKQNDLVYSQTPRIIKLHGSFGYKHRLVVTDEDYRRYPTQSPALVNTVRQSLLENTLCLIGFSATDPNFLQWIGWIHDTLGRNNSPLMYMIVSSELTPTQTRMLSDRNIITVEMSKYDDIENGNHYDCLNRFIQYMHSQWHQNDGRFWKPSANFDADQNQNMTEEKIIRMIESWAKDRQTFPEWVYLPRQRRNALWDRTERWILRMNASDEISPSLKLQFIYETLWRMEKCLSPLDDRQVSSIESIIEVSLLQSVDAEGVSIERTSTSPIPMSSLDLGHMTHFICISLMRYFREEGQFDKWERYNSMIGGVLVKLSPNNRSRLHYERCLKSLFQLDIYKLKSDLEDWPVDDSQPFGEAKRAALQAELGLLSTARTTLEASLSSVRSKSSLRPVTTDYSSVSEESIVMLLLYSVQQAEHYRRREYSELLRVPEEFNERWSVLRNYECDPWDELETFNHSLSRTKSRYVPVRMESSFDIGLRRRTVTWGSNDPSLRQSYRFFRFCEDTGLPFKIPGFGICADTAKKALPQVSEFSPYWAIVALIRIGESKAVESIFGRQTLANMSKDDVDRVVVMCLGAISQVSSVTAKGATINEGLIAGIAKVVPEILSRCCTKCSSGLKEKLIRLLQTVYRSTNRREYEGIDSLVYRLIVASSTIEISAFVPMFLDFPILSWTDPVDERIFPNPMGVLADTKGSRLPVAQISRSAVSRLVSQGRSAKGARKKWIIASLRVLYATGSLTPRQVEQFAAMLWSRESETASPSSIGVTWELLFSLPAPPHVNLAELFFEHLRRLSVDDKEEDNSVGMSSLGTVFCTEICQCSERVEWGNYEAQYVLKQLIACWDRVGQRVGWLERSSYGEAIIDEVRRDSLLVIQALRVMLEVVDLAIIDDYTLTEVDRVVHEIRQSALPSLQLDTIRQVRDARYRIDVAYEIETSLASFDEDTVEDGLVSALILSERLGSKTPGERASLLRVFVGIVQLVRFRRDFTVSFALNVIRRIVVGHDWILKGPVEEQLLSGLAQIMIDTSVPETSRRESKKSLGGADVNTMMAIRQSAVALVSRLFEKYVRAEVDLPEVIMGWKAVSVSDDEFSEIRDAWGS